MESVKKLNKEDYDSIEVVRSIINTSYSNRSFMKKEGKKLRFGNLKFNETGESDIYELINGSDVFVYEIDQNCSSIIVGCVGLKIIPNENYVSLGSLAVDPNYRKLGIGATLLKFAETWSKSKEINKIQIEVISTLKDELQPFYEKHGYIFTGQQICVEELAGGDKFLLEEYSGKVKYLVGVKVIS